MAFLDFKIDIDINLSKTQYINYQYVMLIFLFEKDNEGT